MRQLKSTSRDLRALFERSITVHDILEPLKCCDAGEDAIAVRQQMEKDDFDVLGVQDKGSISGYVNRTSLGEGICKDYLRVFHPSELIAESTPLIDILPILSEIPRVFVLEKNRVTGIVTRGDLQKAPVRMLLFGLVTLLEMHMQRLVQSYYPDDTWQRYLTPKRLEAAKRLLSERQIRNEAIGLSDCLQFCDKRVLLLRSQEARERMGIPSKDDGNTLLKEAEGLRNRLAHAQSITAGTSWTEVITLSGKIEAIVEKCEGADIQ